jgi:cytochrome c oxidase cbb3-type subunit 3
MQKVASYVLSLRGSNPKDPKAPDGDVWVDDNASNTASVTVPATDSTQVK